MDCLSSLELEAWTLKLYGFLKKHRALFSAHSVDFFVCDHWDEVVPAEWRDLTNPVPDKAFLFPNHYTKNDLPASLHSFLVECSELRLPGFLADIDQLQPSSSADQDMLTSFGMSKKKSHEVELLSQAIAELMIKNNLCQVLDLGSGKGYLSEYLALHYGYTVVGVDSQQTNTSGARKRNQKVSKVWEKSCKAKQQDTKQLHNSGRGRNSVVEPPSCEEDYCLKWLETSHPSEETLASDDSEVCSDSLSALFENDIKQDKRTRKSVQQKIKGKHNYSSSHAQRTEEQSLVEQEAEENISECLVQDFTKASSFTKRSFYPVTMELRPDTMRDFLLAAEETSNRKFQSEQPFCLAGLHTCGDLCSTALRLFSEVHSARALCVVGCCYHHITERGDAKSSDVEVGFPLSSVLQGVGASIGRKGRMLACQTINKFSETTSGQALDRIYWRALLQVVIARKFPDIYRNQWK